MKRKTIVDVRYNADKDGNVMPVSIIWKDGRNFDIERIVHVCRASDNDDYDGLRFTVVVCGVQKYLYFDLKQWSVASCCRVSST